MKPQLVYPVIPIEVLQLNEDIKALEQCRKLLDTVDPINVADNREAGFKALRLARVHVSVCYRYAWDKMRQEYLSPVRKKIERKHPRKV